MAPEIRISKLKFDHAVFGVTKQESTMMVRRMDSGLGFRVL